MILINNFSCQSHPFTSIHPRFPFKNTKPGTNLAETYLKRKRIYEFYFINP